MAFLYRRFFTSLCTTGIYLFIKNAHKKITLGRCSSTLRPGVNGCQAVWEENSVQHCTWVISKVLVHFLCSKRGPSSLTMMDFFTPLSHRLSGCLVFPTVQIGAVLAALNSINYITLFCLWDGLVSASVCWQVESEPVYDVYWRSSWVSQIIPPHWQCGLFSRLLFAVWSGLVVLTKFQGFKR